MESGGDGEPGAKRLEESWLLVKNSAGDDEIGKCPETNNNSIKFSEELEDSEDGISVISESEMFKNNSSHSDGEAEKPSTSPQQEEEGDDGEEMEEGEESDSNEMDDKSEDTTVQKDEELLADESEPIITALKKYEKSGVLKEIESSTDSSKQLFPKTNHSLVLLIGVSLVIAILYTNVTSLKNELAKTSLIYEQRIARLEQENQLLKSQLDLLWRLKKTDKQKQEVPQERLSKSDINTPRVHPEQQEPQPREPVTKKVWLGGEREEVVKILDKKYNSLPDYCYHTDENDLFYEYNKENCERKKQKLEERVKKLRTKNPPATDDAIDDTLKFTSDEIWKSKTSETYDDFMEKTADELLKSMHEEILQIKRNRYLNDGDILLQEADKNAQAKESTDRRDDNEARPDDNEERRRKNKRKKKPKQEEDIAWNIKRSSGRETARKNHEAGREENWYLKRKDDREIHRLRAM